MLRTIKELSGYTVRTLDGDLGKVETFYFDDNAWMIRYLAVRIPHDAKDRRILISPVSITGIEPREKQVNTGLTYEMILSSPMINEDVVVSREEEIALHDYFQWPYYWDEGDVPNTLPGDLTAVPLVEMALDVEDQITSEDNQNKPHLRETSAIEDYVIQARDGEVGSVDDLIIEDQTWKIQYFIVNTGSFLSNRKVLLAPQWIQRISYAESAVIVDLKVGTIRNSPEYDPSLPLDHEYQARLSIFYNQNDQDQTGRTS